MDNTTSNVIMVRCHGQGYPTPLIEYSLGGQVITTLNNPPGHTLANDALFIKVSNSYYSLL